MRYSRSRWSLGCLTGSLVLVAAAAGAQPSPDDRAAAESLFRDGRRLMDEGQFAQGCRKLEESLRMDPAPGTLLNLAVCHEKEGKLASAWADFNQALAQARKEGRADRETLAKEHIAALEPQLPKLFLDVPAGVRIPGLRVSRNGSPMNEGAWGTPIPVDPGEVLIEAEAPAHKKWSTKVQMAPKMQQRVTIPQLEDAPVAVVPSASAVSSANGPPPAPTGWTPRQIGGVAAASVGVISLGVGAVMGFRALSKKSDSDSACPNGPDGRVHCSADGASANDDARTAARVSDVTIGLGVVLVGAGAYLFFAGGNKEAGGDAASARRVPIDFGIDAHGARASFGGAF